MFKKYTLKDFKSHKDSTLNFCKGLNAIIGLPDKGKTNLFRGLLWVFNNRAPSDFIRWGTSTKGKRGAEISGTASAEIVIERGGKEIIVSRTKGHEINQYKCGTEKFDTVNKEVPEEVKTALNLTDLNIQSQFDQHYLLFETGGFVASTFNKLTNLDRVDDIVTSLSSELTKTTQRKSFAEEELEKKEKELETFTYIDKLQEDVEIYEEISSELDSVVSGRGALITLISTINENEEAKKTIQAKVDSLHPAIKIVKKNLNELEEIEVKLGSIGDEGDALDRIIQDLVDAQDRFKEINSTLPTLNKELEVRNNQISLESQVDEKAEVRTALSSVITSHNDCYHSIQDIDKAVKSAQEELAKLTDELKTVDTCILCEQKLTEKAKKTMLENL